MVLIGDVLPSGWTSSSCGRNSDTGCAEVESAVASVAVDKVRSYRLELEIVSRVVRETSSIKVSPVSLEHQIMYIESHDAFSRQACIH